MKPSAKRNSSPSIFTDGRNSWTRQILPQWFAAALAVWLLLAAAPAPARADGAALPHRPQERLCRVAGKTFDPSGAALPGVRIEIRGRDGAIAASASTGADGAFGFDLPPGTYRLEARARGFAPVARTLEASNSAEPLALVFRIAPVEDQIVVTATRTEAPLSHIGGSVTVISGDRLAREGILSAAEALRRTAGLTLEQSGGRGQITSLFVRGGESDYTKVLIDGIAVNDPGGSYNFANLPAWSIDRIEIARGPQSALFGSDAMSGVIQIFTKRGGSEGYRPRPEILLEGGSFSSFRYAARIAGGGSRADYSASFSRSDTDNEAANSSFNEAAAAGNFGFRPSEKTEIRAVFRSDASRAGVPGAWAFYRPDPDEFSRRRDLAGGLSLRRRSSGIWEQKLSYTISSSRQYSEDPADSGSFLPEYEGITASYPSYDFPYRTLNRTERQKIGYQSDLAIGNSHLLTAGADYERESGTIGDPELNPLHAVRNNFGGFVQDQWSVRNRFFAAAGVRLEHNESFGFFAAPRLSAAFHAREGSAGGFWRLLKLKANFGLGIKEPSLVESYSLSPYFRGNPDLLPEKSVSFDAGIEQYFGSGNGVAEVTYFDNRYRDQIGYLVTDYSTLEGSFFNIGRTRARGIETGLRQRFGRWEAGGSYTYVDSAIVESSVPGDPVYAEGEDLFRRPRHSGHVDVSLHAGRWTAGAAAVLVGSRVDSDFSGLGITRNPGYAVLNLMLDFRLPGGLHLYTAVDNALNRRYMEVLGYPAPRAGFRVGLRSDY